MGWAKANRVLPREHNGHNKHSLPTTQEKTWHMGLTRWSIPKSNWLYSWQPKMEKLYTVCKNKIGSWLWLRSWTPYCQIQLKLKKVGKTTRPFRYDLNQIPNNYKYICTCKSRLKLKKVGKTNRPFRSKSNDLNQIPYDYTVEVRNRFKGLDLTDRVLDELWVEVCDIVQETGIKTIPKEKKCKKANGSLRRPYK